MKPTLLAVLFLSVAAVSAAAAPPHFDHVFRGGRLVDGTGNGWTYRDVGVVGDRIAFVGRLQDGAYTADHEHDVAGLVIAPGFIDVHTHADETLHRIPDAANFVRDGVTTIVTGNCGASVDDVGDYFRRLETDGVALNVATLIGHNTVLRAVKGNVAGALTEVQMAEALALVDRAMRDGAVGMSTGLIYSPGQWSETQEIIDLQAVAASYGGIYVSHMRSEGQNIVSAIEEALRVGREAGSRVQISHFKLSAYARDQVGGSDATLKMIDDARAAGQEVWLDQYPYTASSTGLSQLVPSWLKEDGPERLNELLADPDTVDRAVAEMQQRYADERGLASMDYVVIASCRAFPQLNGLNLVQATQMLKLREQTGQLPESLPAEGQLPKVSMEDQFRATLEIQAHGGASCVFHSMADADVSNIMAHPVVMVCSDSGVREFGKGVPHPRGYGANARVLGEYVRERQHLRLEEAVRKMTSLPATAFRLPDRGLVAAGYVADLVVFDPDTVRDRATFKEPHQYATGFALVMVNGRPVVVDDALTGAMPGRPVPGPGARPARAP